MKSHGRDTDNDTPVCTRVPVANRTSERQQSQRGTTNSDANNAILVACFLQTEVADTNELGLPASSRARINACISESKGQAHPKRLTQSLQVLRSYTKRLTELEGDYGVQSFEKHARWRSDL